MIRFAHLQGVEVSDSTMQDSSNTTNFAFETLGANEILESEQESNYTNLQCPFKRFDAKSAFIHNFIFATPQSADLDNARQDSKPKKPKFLSHLNLNLLPLKPRRPNVKIRGHGRTKMGERFSDIMLDSTRNRTLSTFGVNEVSISQDYTLPLKGTPMEKIELTGGYTMLSNNVHQIKAQIGSVKERWDFQLGYDFTNTDLVSTKAHSAMQMNPYYQNHALRAKIGLAPNANHRYSVNFAYQRGIQGDLIDDYGDSVKVWNSPNYDRISAYISGDSKFNAYISLKSKLYYNSFLNVSKASWRDMTFALNENLQSFNMVDNYTIGLIETFRFEFNESVNVKLGLNLKQDNRKRTAENWSGRNQNLKKDFSDLSTTIFAEYSQALHSKVRLVINGSYDRNDMLKSVVNNIVANNISEQGWTLQGAIYVDVSDYWVIYLNAIKNSQVPTLKEIPSSLCSARTLNPYSVESIMVYGIGTCIKW